MKKSSKTAVYIISAIVLVVGLYLIFGNLQNSAITGLPDQTASVVWQGANISITSPWFNNYPTGSLNPSAGAYAKYNLCGTTYGNEVSILNTYVSGNTLDLSSSITGSKTRCDGNFLTAEGTFPKGVLSGTCNLQAGESQNDYSVSSCSVIVDGKTIYSNSVTQSQSSNQRENPPTRTGTFSVNISDNSDVQVILEDSVGYTGGSSAKVTLSFMKEIPSVTNHNLTTLPIVIPNGTVIPDSTISIVQNATSDGNVNSTELQQITNSVQTNNPQLNSTQVNQVVDTLISQNSKFVLTPQLIIYGIIGIIIIGGLIVYFVRRR
jgi:hypothetical protein